MRPTSTHSASSACWGRAGHWPRPATKLPRRCACSTARALWRGTALSDFAFEPFAQTEIARLEELRLIAAEEWLEAELALGRHAVLVPEVEALVAAHPLRERLRALR